MKLPTLFITLVFAHICTGMDQPVKDIQEPSLNEIFDDCSERCLYLFSEPRIKLPKKIFKKIQQIGQPVVVKKVKKRKKTNKTDTQLSSPSASIQKPQTISYKTIPFEYINILKREFGCSEAKELRAHFIDICGHLFHHPQCNNDSKEYGPYFNDKYHMLFIKIKDRVTATYNPCKNTLTTEHCSFEEMMNTPKCLLPEKLLCNQDCPIRSTLPDPSYQSSCSQQK